ncbi:hypothetical protein StoSoilB3_19750 [Arthrobacter sp. StoSoilB3]|nr:hypothetical protein ANMWB30_19870 [Arthrobacter sp. MWB30]BCW10598.1 hypothetical protein NtRootA2_18800 [Arthrobacter sp. NtRootA2]BCW14681.1 hypothetical protein NtRootA4_16600 [Arthrobacter sp. NtRootA4]BCW23016.1 hypothetical protein NtRootC7_18830 [Arthrobacter sp. NtRootC7]BCW27284.1 hypothetical protein NtRootC45_18840 [Arthrobacter sp. NtRootC45]BCW31551.1 hypothetical protein NtRootD5_18820 [Arthrobacter sp. NtRootD5]BCW40440.1 hypothetical protein StoSoilB3_19750 [Arthrobacter s
MPVLRANLATFPVCVMAKTDPKEWALQQKAHMLIACLAPALADTAEPGLPAPGPL